MTLMVVVIVIVEGLQMWPYLYRFARAHTPSVAKPFSHSHCCFQDVC